MYPNWLSNHMQKMGRELTTFSKVVANVDKEHQKNCYAVIQRLEELIIEVEKKRVSKQYKKLHNEYLKTIQKVKKSTMYMRKFLINYSDIYYKKSIESLDNAIDRIEKSDLFN